MEAAEHRVVQVQTEVGSLLFQEGAGRLLQKGPQFASIPRVDLPVMLLDAKQAQTPPPSPRPPHQDALLAALLGSGVQGEDAIQDAPGLGTKVAAGEDPGIQGGPVPCFETLGQAAVLGGRVVAGQSGQETAPRRGGGAEIGPFPEELRGGGTSGAGGSTEKEQTAQQAERGRGHGSYIGLPVMPGQSSLRGLGGLVPLLLLVGCGPAPGRTVQASVPAIRFEQPQQDLGEILGGRVLTLRFPFRVRDSPVRIQHLKTSCGCLDPRLEADGQVVPFGSPWVPGSRGAVVVDFHTAGFSGAKHAELEVLGVGEGLPARLTVDSRIRPWFTVDPPRLQLGELPGKGPWEFSVRVRGPEPFRLLEPAAVLHGCEVEGLPSPVSAREQSLRLRILDDGEDGESTWFLRLEADNGLHLVLPVQYTKHGEVWLRPPRILPLGELHSGSPIQASVEVGVSEGTLGISSAHLEGIPGARVETLPIKEKVSYRLAIRLPGDLPVGPLQGLLRLTLDHQVGGVSHTLRRSVRLVGLIR